MLFFRASPLRNMYNHTYKSHFKQLTSVLFSFHMADSITKRKPTKYANCHLMRNLNRLNENDIYTCIDIKAQVAIMKLQETNNSNGATKQNKKLK